MPGNKPLDEGVTPDIMTLDDLSPEQQKALALQILAKHDAAAHAAAVQATEEAEIERNLEKENKSEAERQRNEPHTWIEMQPMGEGDTSLQYFGANGIDYWIPKNVRIPVPQSVMEVIKTCVYDSWQPIADHVTGMKRMVQVKAKRFSISEFGPVSPKELEDWRAAQERRRQAEAQAALGQQAVNDYMRQEPSFVPEFLKPATYKDVS